VRGRGTALTVCTVATITELARLQGAAGTAPA